MGVGVGSAVGVGVGSGLLVVSAAVNSFSGLVVLSFVRSSCVAIGVSFVGILEVTESLISSTSTSQPENNNKHNVVSIIKK